MTLLKGLGTAFIQPNAYMSLSTGLGKKANLLLKGAKESHLVDRYKRIHGYVLTKEHSHNLHGQSDQVVHTQYSLSFTNRPITFH